MTSHLAQKGRREHQAVHLTAGPRLTPWLEQLAKEIMDTGLGETIVISDVARELFRPGFHQHSRDGALYPVYWTEDYTRQELPDIVAFPAGRNRSRMWLC